MWQRFSNNVIKKTKRGSGQPDTRRLSRSRKGHRTPYTRSPSSTGRQPSEVSPLLCLHPDRDRHGGRFSTRGLPDLHSVYLNWRSFSYSLPRFL
ncbi:hypothetical protein VTN96DRAFT_10077 [Rasamsonia emersonii]